MFEEENGQSEDVCETEDPRVSGRLSKLSRANIGTAVKKPHSPVEDALTQLEKEIAINYELVSMLESKIDVILTQIPEDGSNAKEEGYPSSSSMVRAINQLTASVRRSNVRLADIRDRVEL